MFVLFVYSRVYRLLIYLFICLLIVELIGLDTFTARHVIETLKNISHTNRTMILSIHQPRYDIFASFDEIILLAAGRVVYCGTLIEMMNYFHSIHLSYPILCNPADYILDITSIDVS